MNKKFYLLKFFLFTLSLTISWSTYGQVGYKQSGMASFYGKNFQGKKTACGEVFDKDDYTAAHRNLPYNAILKVTNIKNKKHVFVRVNDRGPYSNSRILDISHAAAKKIDLVSSGITKVNIECISLDGILPEMEVDTICPRPLQPTILADYSKLKPGKIYDLNGLDTTLSGYGIQILSVTNPENVRAPEKKGFRNLSLPLFVEVSEINNVLLYRLVAGNFNNRSSAQEVIEKFKKMGYDCFIKKHINISQ
ncbi:MAG TPA: septal ring lytic transglycosylase RlpA family protein [Cytophagaceae bacterium]